MGSRLGSCPSELIVNRPSLAWRSFRGRLVVDIQAHRSKLLSRWTPNAFGCHAPQGDQLEDLPLPPPNACQCHHCGLFIIRGQSWASFATMAARLEYECREKKIFSSSFQPFKVSLSNCTCNYRFQLSALMVSQQCVGVGVGMAT